MFELETALANWKRSLVANDTVGPEEALELEEHLRESVADLGSVGLSQREAFLVGADRLGHPSELEQEYAKIDLATQWRKPIFWMLTGYIGMVAANCVVSLIVTIASTAMTFAGAGGTATGIVAILVMALGWIGLAVLAFRQHVNFGSRGDYVPSKWMFMTGMLLIITPVLRIAGRIARANTGNLSSFGETEMYVVLAGWVIQLSLVAFCFFVMWKFNKPAASVFDSANAETN